MIDNLFLTHIKTLGLALVVLVTCGHFSDVNAQNVFRIEEDTTFELGNSGASSFLFNWSDLTNVADPTLELVAGNTYRFERTTGSHPFVITDDTLEVTGTDGSFARTTAVRSVIDEATLEPIADFTANSAPTTDFILWSPTADDLGQFYYTCNIQGHRGMTGSIRVVAAAIPEPSSIALIFGLAGAGIVRRRRKSV